MRHPILPLFPEKFFADTADMTPDGAAYYLVLLAHAWVRGGSLPNDPDKLRLMLRLPKMRWARLRQQIMERWTLGEDGRLHQKRMDEEWQRRERHTAEVQNGVTEKREKPRRNVHHVMAKKPMITTRARRPDPSPSLNSLPKGRESLEGAASLSVRSHASPRQTENQAPSPDPAAEARIAAGLASLAYELRRNSERERAQEKLNTFVKH
jgi:uncharacterized protein YdaU (DUF1376 family)